MYGLEDNIHALLRYLETHGEVDDDRLPEWSAFQTWRLTTKSKHPFGWMQDAVFGLFDQDGRSYRWQTAEQLVDVTEDLP